MDNLNYHLSFLIFPDPTVTISSYRATNDERKQRATPVSGAVHRITIVRILNTLVVYRFTHAEHTHTVHTLCQDPRQAVVQSVDATRSAVADQSNHHTTNDPEAIANITYCSTQAPTHCFCLVFLNAFEVVPLLLNHTYRHIP